MRFLLAALLALRGLAAALASGGPNSSSPLPAAHGAALIRSESAQASGVAEAEALVEVEVGPGGPEAPERDEAASTELSRLQTSDAHPLASLMVVRAAGGVKMFLPIGHVVALYNPKYRRFVKMSKDDMVASKETSETDFYKTWAEERFLMVDAGKDDIAFHSKAHNRFISMDGTKGDMRLSSVKGADALPEDWTWETFTPVEADGGNIAFYCKVHKKFMLMRNTGIMKTSRTSSMTKPRWASQKFKIIDFGWKDTDVNYPFPAVYAKTEDVTQLESTIRDLRADVEMVQGLARKAHSGSGKGATPTHAEAA